MANHKHSHEAHKNREMRAALDRVAAAKPVAKWEPITIEDIAAEFDPEASIRGNTNLGIYEIVTPTAVHAIDSEKVAKLSSKAEMRAYVDELKANGKA